MPFPSAADQKPRGPNGTAGGTCLAADVRGARTAGTQRERARRPRHHSEGLARPRRELRVHPVSRAALGTWRAPSETAGTFKPAADTAARNASP